MVSLMTSLWQNKADLSICIQATCIQATFIQVTILFPLGVQLTSKDLTPQVKRKNMEHLEWKPTKCMYMPNVIVFLSYIAWEDLLKFDTTYSLKQLSLKYLATV